jgi:RNA polymerase sigma factor (sigma-70 family)
MANEDEVVGPGESRIDDVETTWRRRHDPLRFALIYGRAVRRYLLALLRDEHDADDSLQEILLQVTREGFGTYDPERSRFRDYLKAVVRNTALRRLRRRASESGGSDKLERHTSAAADEAERDWLDQWRSCVLDQALRALERRQREAGEGNLSYTVIRLSLDHPGDDSAALAARASQQSGRPLSAEAFRKQLSRARRALAELIVAEVRQTLDGASDDEVVEELAELGLLGHVKDYLPPGG